MRILFIVSPFLGTDDLDTAGIPEAAAMRGHEILVLRADQDDLGVAVVASLPVDVTICRFANQPHAIDIVTALQIRGVPTVCSGPAIDVARNQIKTLAALAQASVPYPLTIVADKQSNADQVLQHLGTPVVCKRPFTCGGAGVWLAGSPRSLSGALEALPGDDQLVVQRFHAEANAQDLRLLVVGYQVVAAIRRVAAPGDFRANLYLGGTGHHHTPSTRESNLAVAAARAVGLDVAGIDILPTEDGPLVIEVNPKPGSISMEAMPQAVVELAEARAATAS